MIKNNLEKCHKKKFHIFDFQSNKLFFYLLMLLFFVKICNPIPPLHFPQSITLLNGNIFIIHKDGIDIYDASLENKVKNILNFTEINYEVFKQIVISRFSPDKYGYIISIIRDIIYIFDYEGNFLCKDTNQIYINGDKNYYYDLLPIEGNKKKIYYMIGYVNNSNNINLKFYKYDIVSNHINNSYNIEPFKFKYQGMEKNINNQRFFVCQLMSNISQENVIVCFVPLGCPHYIVPMFINLTTYEIFYSTSNAFLDIKNSTHSLRALVNDDKSKSLICFYINEKKMHLAQYIQSMIIVFPTK